MSSGQRSESSLVKNKPAASKDTKSHIDDFDLIDYDSKAWALNRRGLDLQQKYLLRALTSSRNRPWRTKYSMEIRSFGDTGSGRLLLACPGMDSGTRGQHLGYRCIRDRPVALEMPLSVQGPENLLVKVVLGSMRHGQPHLQREAEGN